MLIKANVFKSRCIHTGIHIYSKWHTIKSCVYNKQIQIKLQWEVVVGSSSMGLRTKQPSTDTKIFCYRKVIFLFRCFCLQPFSLACSMLKQQINIFFYQRLQILVTAKSLFKRRSQICFCLIGSNAACVTTVCLCNHHLFMSRTEQYMESFLKKAVLQDNSKLEHPNLKVMLFDALSHLSKPVINITIPILFIYTMPSRKHLHTLQFFMHFFFVLLFCC